MMALAGMASAGTEIDTLWTIDFGSEHEGGYKITAGSYTGFSLTGKWGLNDYRQVSGGVLTGAVVNGKNEDGTDKVEKDRIHLQNSSEKGMGITWADNFQLTVTFTLPESNVSASNDWPVIAAIEPDSLRFGPYLADGNKVYFDGNLTDKTTSSTFTLGSGIHTAVMSKVGTNLSLVIDGKDVATATWTGATSGTIQNITLGGGTGGNYRINSTMHSVSVAKIVPEPTTATLSLLALAGLAARRRRK